LVKLKGKKQENWYVWSVDFMVLTAGHFEK